MQMSNHEIHEKFTLLSPAFFADPYPFYHRLQATDPVHWSNLLQSWIVTRYNDVIVGLRDPRLSVRRDNTYFGMLPEGVQEELQPLRRFYSLWLMLIHLITPEFEEL